MRKLLLSAAGVLLSLATPSTAGAQAKPAPIPTLSASGTIVFGVLLAAAALFSRRRR